ncbi:AsmA family protein [Iodobacter sp. HSC-16F04]|uniref:AsmA family protein n=1 Tax=Iodobacter violaceini TaxID=3044271 RepID=A0ABX0KZL9_9NEIS|nr:AsmA family protein [Iodobacter violacea]NHQ87840.1 AsmA family protein [Iodobacter violacea]
MMKKTRTLLFCLLLFFVVIVCLPLILPLNNYKPQLEKRLSSLLQAQVSLETVEFSYQPWPVFTLNNVKIDGEAGKIEQISVPLSLFNVLQHGKSLKNVTVAGVKLKPALAFTLPKRFAALEQDRITLGDVELTKASVLLDQGELGPIDGVIRFAKNGAMDDLQLADKQGHLDVHIKPKGDNIGVTVQASNWELPLGYPVVFERLYLSGEGSPEGLLIDDIRGETYGGVLSGKAQLTRQTDWNLQGQLLAKGIHTEPLSKIFSPATFVSGRMDADVQFVYSAADYLKLFAHPQVDASFLLRDGAVHNMDLVAQLRAGETPAGRGGQTRFDTLKGKMLIRDRSVQLQGMALGAGKFNAQGAVQIAAGRINGSVSGRLQAGVLAIANQIRLSGDLSKPALNSGNAARTGEQPPATSVDELLQ